MTSEAQCWFDHIVATRTSGELKLRERACGYNHNMYNMLLDPALDNALKPATHFAHDWMHTLVVHGAWNALMFAMVTCLITAGVDDAPAQLGRYISEWTLPARLATSTANLADIFSTHRWTSSSKAKNVKCPASDALSIYAIVACYVQAVFLRAGICPLVCRAYILCADVMDLLLSVPRGGVTTNLLRETIDKFLDACVAADLKCFMHPKFHWLTHLPRELDRFATLLSCWVHERKHKMVKRFCNEQRNTERYEASTLSEVTCQHLAALKHKAKFDYRVMLCPPSRDMGPRLASRLREELHLPDGLALATSKRGRISEFEVISIRDVVLYTNGVAWAFRSRWMLAPTCLCLSIIHI